MLWIVWQREFSSGFQFAFCSLILLKPCKVKHFLAAAALSEAGLAKSRKTRTHKRRKKVSHTTLRKETNEKEGQTFGTRVRHLFCHLCLSCSLTFSCGLWWGTGHGICAAGLCFLLLCLFKAPLTRLERTTSEESTLRCFTRLSNLDRNRTGENPCRCGGNMQLHTLKGPELEPTPKPFSCAWQMCWLRQHRAPSIVTLIMTYERHTWGLLLHTLEGILALLISAGWLLQNSVIFLEGSQTLMN